MRPRYRRYRPEDLPLVLARRAVTCKKNFYPVNFQGTYMEMCLCCGNTRKPELVRE